ncbi:MAG: ATP-binding protein [Vulcanimicrobiaceae bacterium]
MRPETERQRPRPSLTLRKTPLRSGWYILKWPRLVQFEVAAEVDRLMHHAHLIEIRGKSYRLHEHSLAARNRKAKTTA